MKKYCGNNRGSFFITKIVLPVTAALIALTVPSNKGTESTRDQELQNGTFTISDDNQYAVTCKPPSGTARNCHNTETNCDITGSTGRCPTSERTTD